MYNKRLSMLALCSAISIAGCQKEDDVPVPPVDNPTTLQYLVKTIEYDMGTVATINYHPDSTIRDIYYTNQSAAGMLEYSWTGKKVTTVSYHASLYKDSLLYTNGRLTAITNRNKTGYNPTSYKLEYAYNANGSLAELNYYQTNEAGTKLVATTTYAYAANGDLTTFTTTQKSNLYKIIYSIEGWSAECEINPWLYMQAGLTENYTFYNYPVLRTLKKWPIKITKSVQAVGQAASVEKIDVNDYTIVNKRLDKTVTSLTYPKHPDLDQSYTIVYKY